MEWAVGAAVKQGETGRPGRRALGGRAARRAQAARPGTRLDAGARALAQQTKQRAVDDHVDQAGHEVVAWGGRGGQWRAIRARDRGRGGGGGGAAAGRLTPAPAHLGLGRPVVVSAVACTLSGMRRLLGRLLGRLAGLAGAAAAKVVAEQHCIEAVAAEQVRTISSVEIWLWEPQSQWGFRDEGDVTLLPTLCRRRRARRSGAGAGGAGGAGPSCVFFPTSKLLSRPLLT